MPTMSLLIRVLLIADEHRTNQKSYVAVFKDQRPVFLEKLFAEMETPRPLSSSVGKQGSTHR